MATHNSLGYFDPRFDCLDSAEPGRRYAIFSSPRTGSNYLCSRLGNTRDRLGMPMEYLHADAVRVLGARLLPEVIGTVPVGRFLDAVARVRTTRDGWFGTKIQPNQLLPLFNGDLNGVAGFLRNFDRLVFMTRDDKLGQAISGAIAHATGVWFNFGDEPNLAASDLVRLFPLIEFLQAQYVEEDRQIRVLEGQLAGRPLLNIRYEDIQENPQKVFERVLGFLGHADAALVEEHGVTVPTRKPLGAFAEKLRIAYLSRLSEPHKGGGA